MLITNQMDVNTQKNTPIIQSTRSGEFVKEWDSFYEVGRSQFNATNVLQCCTGDTKSGVHKGFKWSFKKQS